MCDLDLVFVLFQSPKTYKQFINECSQKVNADEEDDEMVRMRNDSLRKTLKEELGFESMNEKQRERHSRVEIAFLAHNRPPRRGDRKKRAFPELEEGKLCC